MKLQFRHGRFLKLDFFKFLTVGFINTIFGYTVYATLLFFQTPYLFALFLSTFFGIIFNYFSFGRIVFYEQNNWLVFYRFLIAYSIIFSINVIVLSTLTYYFIFSPYIGQIICIPINVILSWLLMNYWVFKR